MASLEVLSLLCWQSVGLQKAESDIPHRSKPYFGESWKSVRCTLSSQPEVLFGDGKVSKAYHEGRKGLHRSLDILRAPFPVTACCM